MAPHSNTNIFWWLDDVSNDLICTEVNTKGMTVGPCLELPLFRIYRSMISADDNPLVLCFGRRRNFSCTKTASLGVFCCSFKTLFLVMHLHKRKLSTFMSYLIPLLTQWLDTGCEPDLIFWSPQVHTGFGQFWIADRHSGDCLATTNLWNHTAWVSVVSLMLKNA